MNEGIIIPRETKSLIQSSQAVLYPAKIPFQHNQLKNYISTADPNILYYASTFEIYALNLSTRKRTLIKSLPWKPLCLDAAHGWICVGGDENGQCAFVSIEESHHGETASQSYAEVDDLLPLNLDPEYRQFRNDFRRTPQAPRYSMAPKYEVQHHELGGDRVNAVRIHVLPSNGQGIKDEVVAVMANNDRTVRIFSLSQSCLLSTLDFPTRMNHASISPDGKILLAVGDEVQPGNETRAFFCKRMDTPNIEMKDEIPYSEYEWYEAAKPRLVQAETEEDPCFCTAFSPSGHICAVASQSGIITFFDMAHVRDDMETGDAVIAVLKSSRPSIRAVWSGAVRSMCFSPVPWDLFTWAEDQGRVCVVDLRTRLQSRQTIELKTDSPDVERIDVHDYHSTSEERQLEIERRFVERHREALEAQDHLAAVSHTADYLELAAERRRIEGEATAIRDNIHSLSPSERQMIDSIGLRRLQSSHPDSSDIPSAAPISVNYTPGRPPESSAWTGLPSSSTFHGRSNGTASIHDFMRHRNWERSRANDRSYQPRRRSSVIISNAISNAPNSLPQQPSSLAPIGTSTPTFSASPSRLPSGNAEIAIPHLNDASDPWQTISNAMSSTSMPPETVARLRGVQSRNHERRMQAAATPQAPSDRRTQTIQGYREQSRTEHADAMDAIDNRARDREPRQAIASSANILYDEIDREVVLRRLDEPRRRTRYEEGLVTMGIGWSVDGRSLFVATEEGVLEYPVNIEERKTFPGIALL